MAALSHRGTYAIYRHDEDIGNQRTQAFEPCKYPLGEAHEEMHWLHQAAGVVNCSEQQETILLEWWLVLPLD